MNAWRGADWKGGRQSPGAGRRGGRHFGQRDHSHPSSWRLRAHSLATPTWADGVLQISLVKQL